MKANQVAQRKEFCTRYWRSSLVLFFRSDCSCLARIGLIQSGSMALFCLSLFCCARTELICCWILSRPAMMRWKIRTNRVEFSIESSKHLTVSYQSRMVHTLKNDVCATRIYRQLDGTHLPFELRSSRLIPPAARAAVSRA